MKSIKVKYVPGSAPFYGSVSVPYIVINQGVTRLFFSDIAYDRFLATIC